MRKQNRIGGSIFTARELVAFVDVEDVIAEGLQVLGFPGSVGKRGRFIQAEVIRRPAPPAEQRRSGDTGVVDLPDQGTVGFQLMVVIRAHAYGQSFR